MCARRDLKHPRGPGITINPSTLLHSETLCGPVVTRLSRTVVGFRGAHTTLLRTVDTDLKSIFDIILLTGISSFR
jgi:hypothetical protein